MQNKLVQPREIAGEVFAIIFFLSVKYFHIMKEDKDEMISPSSMTVDRGPVFQ